MWGQRSLGTIIPAHGVQSVGFGASSWHEQRSSLDLFRGLDHTAAAETPIPVLCVKGKEKADEGLSRKASQDGNNHRKRGKGPSTR